MTESRRPGSVGGPAVYLQTPAGLLSLSVCKKQKGLWGNCGWAGVFLAQHESRCGNEEGKWWKSAPNLTLKRKHETATTIPLDVSVCESERFKNGFMCRALELKKTKRQQITFLLFGNYEEDSGLIKWMESLSNYKLKQWYINWIYRWISLRLILESNRIQLEGRRVKLKEKRTMFSICD